MLYYRLQICIRSANNLIRFIINLKNNMDTFVKHFHLALGICDLELGIFDFINTLKHLLFELKLITNLFNCLLVKFINLLHLTASQSLITKVNGAFELFIFNLHLFYFQFEFNLFILLFLEFLVHFLNLAFVFFFNLLNFFLCLVFYFLK